MIGEKIWVLSSILRDLEALKWGNALLYFAFLAIFRALCEEKYTWSTEKWHNFQILQKKLAQVTEFQSCTFHTMSYSYVKLHRKGILSKCIK